MTILNRTRQLVAKIGTEGTFDSGSIHADNAGFQIFDYSMTQEVGTVERRAARGTIGAIQPLLTTKMWRARFSVELKGPGVAGDVPRLGVLLRACGFSQTIQDGSAVIGSVIASSKNLTPSQKPTVAGTFGGARNGWLRITISALVANTSITFRLEFFPSDGSANYETESLSQTDATAETAVGTQLSGVTVDFGDPDASTAGYQIGDVYFVPLTSDQSEQVIYKPISLSIPCLDMTFIEPEDASGRRKSMHSARGNVRLVCGINEISRLEFEFLGVAAEPANGVVAQAALTGIEYDATIPVPFLDIGVSFYGGTFNQCFTDFRVDAGNNLAARLCAQDASGVEGVRITRRRVTGQINPEATVPATWNPFSKLFGNTPGILSVTIGSEAGNTIVVAGQNVSISGVGDEETDDILRDPLELAFNEPETSETNEYEELTISFQ